MTNEWTGKKNAFLKKLGKEYSETKDVFILFGIDFSIEKHKGIKNIQDINKEIKYLKHNLKIQKKLLKNSKERKLFLTLNEADKFVKKETKKKEKENK